MRRTDLSDLEAFLAVAEERSFTRAAARLGTSQPLVSNIVRRLEAAMGVKLLTRTTRYVDTTDAGQELVETLRPALDNIYERFSTLSAQREKPSGTIRITTSRHAAETILWPAIAKLVRDNSNVSIELAIEPHFTDSLVDRIDAAVRLGASSDEEMISARIGPDLRMAAVAAPSYLADRAVPITPHELTNHLCINFRSSTDGGLSAWKFEKGGRELSVRGNGRMIFNDTALMLSAAVNGLGVAFVTEDRAIALIEQGKLIRVLEDWCAPFPGYHLYYPRKRQLAPAFALLLNALRHRA